MSSTEPFTAAPAQGCVQPGDSALGMLVLEEVVTGCNERFCSMIGCEPADVIGKPFLDLCPEFQSDGAFSQERWQRRWHAARAGIPQWFPWQFHHCDGSRAHGLVHLVKDPSATDKLVARIHDLTGLARAGWTTAGSQARAQEVLDHFKAVIFVKDCEGRYLFANRELERAVRTPAERIVGYTDRDIWQNEIAERFRANDAQVLKERRGVEFEVTAEVGGQLRTFLSFKIPLFTPAGELYGLCGISTDITDRKRTQDALTNAALAVSSAQGTSVLQELVRYLATILEVDAAMIAMPGGPGGTAHVHAFILDGHLCENIDYPVAGTPCESVFGQSFRIYPSGLRERFPGIADFEKLGLESYAGFPLNDSTGAPVGLLAVLSRKVMTSSEFIESILKIFAVRASAELERQRTEETLRRSEASYRAIFEASEDAVFIHDWETGRVVDVNRRACEIYGYSYEEMKNIRVGDVSSGVYPYTASEARKRLGQARAGKTLRFEWHRKNKDGSLHWDEVVVRTAIIAGERRILAFTREITERKQAEQALRQAQKMEALGHLTGGIAHDFNNLLTSIMGYVVLAGEHPAAAGEPRLAKYLDQAHASCVRARDLIQQMLTFSRGQRGQPRPVALAPLVRQSVKLFGSSLPSTLDIQTSIDEDVPAVMLDPVHLDQILLNLCLNARDATSGVGRIHVSVARAAPVDEICTACREHVSGAFVQLCVEDDGPGIAPEVIDRIFEPFFTTKDAGKGSGMGLASVHGIVHELSGHIVVDTVQDGGTRFCVLLPALTVEPTEAGRASTAREPAAPVHLHGHVLVVDDDQSVSLYMRALLENWGLEVTLAGSAADALSLVRRGAARFDLVVTDQMMPRTTGIELAGELARIAPDLPVILYTGYAEAIAPGDAERARLRAVLMKPVDPKLLLTLLQAHLPHAAAAVAR
jgi:PAS domain S-box-containing protein